MSNAAPNTTKITSSNASTQARNLPNNAILDRERRLFRLRKSSGGTIAKGGFGVWINAGTSDKCIADDDDAKNIPVNDDSNREKQNCRPEPDGTRKLEKEDINDAKQPLVQVVGKAASVDPVDQNSNDVNHDTSGWYLFIEEVIYLHERGLLEAYNEEDARMDSYDLYSLLAHHQVPLAVYLVYAHLRQQTFKVVRYSTKRREIIEEQMHQLTTKGQDRYVPQLRVAAFEATLPPLENMASHLSWDVYPPNVTYQKRNPGLPLYSVLVTPHATRYPVHDIRTLLHDNEPVPVKVATVADTGTVILFGVANFGAPSIMGGLGGNQVTKTAATTKSNDAEPKDQPTQAN